jgi:hypothetical protein
MAYGCLMECIPLEVEAVNTHRDKPKVRKTRRNFFFEYVSFLFRIVDQIEQLKKH